MGYSTALDIYNIICFAFTFAALFEFVLINFIGMFVQRFVCITFILIIIGFFIIININTFFTTIIVFFILCHFISAVAIINQ